MERRNVPFGESLIGINLIAHDGCTALARLNKIISNAG